ncbi:3 beta-hydroxysteroid dehydrogenase/Delta 5--_4-isomerase [Pontiella desulfatans]|uniref:3 beta-hydroxysteroid dehydrogenase/Delta 5-->4-isomerase n=1 Tax=Pontiella desulfatans TaxID=2750659 RepID=A0A6C2U4T8_PONDE|nr:NAD(P)-dependent oxidoreductase [Pontiella desulfatans]VGO15072.1 3 beta-hydroxysteroid dehydrogenase/Delta 5-->4-isomerase [Pontiella desulfatans]
MKVFIVGGTGLLGSHITTQLLEKGHEVTLFSRHADAIPAYRTMSGVQLVNGSYYDEEALKKALPGHDACINIVLTWGDSARTMLDNDTRPCVMLMELAAQVGIKSFVFVSSTAALGEYRRDMDEGMISKPMEPPFDFYCASKRATELFLLAQTYRCDMRCNIVRPGAFFGRPAVKGVRMHGNDIFTKLARSIRDNEPVEIVENTGTQYLAVQDLACVVNACLYGSMNREIYFVLSKIWYTHEQIAKAAIRIAGSKCDLVLLPNPEKDEPKLYKLDKIKNHFGFEFDAWPEIQGTLEYLITVPESSDL